jgi:hypothetical protein
MSSGSIRRLRRLKLSKHSTPDSGKTSTRTRKMRGEKWIKQRFSTWVIQLGYLAWLGLRWQAQKRDAARLSRGR